MTFSSVILAGGLGSRLKPYTAVLPKPLLPLGDKPILEVIINKLKRHRCKKIILAVNHQADVIKSFFGNGKKWGVNISYSLEKKRLGTAGPLKNISLIKDQNIFVLNGDILTDLNFEKLMECHLNSSECLMTIATTNRNHLVDYGVIYSNKNYIKKIDEKPKINYEVSMGVYVINTKLLTLIPKNQYFGMDDLIKKMLSQKLKINSYKFSGYWKDIGRPDDYEEAINDFINDPDYFS